MAQRIREVGVEKKPWVRRDAQPYQPGNTAGLRHGGYSDRAIAAKAAEVHAQMMENYQWVAEADAGMVETLCRATVRYRLLDDYVGGILDGKIEVEIRTRNGPKWITGPDAVPEATAKLLIASERAVMKATEQLGLDPTSRARLLKDMGFAKQLAGQSVQDLVAKGRELRRGQ